MRHRLIALLCAVGLAGCATEPYIALGPGASDDPLQQQLALDAALGGDQPTQGNKVTVLRDGRETFPAMFRAMAAARDSIDLEYYIFEDVRSGDETLGDLLVRKLNEGVAVNISRDGFGSLPASRRRQHARVSSARCGGGAGAEESQRPRPPQNHGGRRAGGVRGRHQSG